MRNIFCAFISTALFLQCANDNMKQNQQQWEKASIYEVNIRQYTEEGTFAAFKDHLPRLKDMGIDILWFMPIHPIGEVNRKGELGSYYSVKDYYGVNPEFGTIQEFRQLVAEIHGMGMYVILDWVANHTAWDNLIAEKHPDWYTKDNQGNFQPPIGTDWHDVIDLNYQNNNLRQYMTSAMEYWVKDINVDGFRCDVAGMVPLDYWEESIPKLRKIKPLFFLAESDDPKLLKNAFDADYNWKFYHLLKDIAGGKSDIVKIQKYFEHPTKIYPNNSLTMNFLDNHDENSWGRVMENHFGQQVYPLMTMIFTMPGIPMIYSGQETKLAKKLEFFEKDEIDWLDFPNHEFYKSLINLRKSESAFWQYNSSIKFLKGLPSGLVGYKRVYETQVCYVLLNLTNQNIPIKTNQMNNSILFKDEKSDLNFIAPYGFLVHN